MEKKPTKNHPRRLMWTLLSIMIMVLTCLLLYEAQSSALTKVLHEEENKPAHHWLTKVEPVKKIPGCR